MNFISNCFIGVLIGAGAILPGISSGVLCVIFGIYEKLLDSILNFLKDIKNNMKFLLPILIGVCIGVILFGNLLRFLFNNYLVQTMFCFIGIILGGVPALIKTANQKNGFRLHYILYTLITFLLTLILLHIENDISSTLHDNTSLLYLILAGFVMSIGVVVPGISSTVLLMIMRIYDIYLVSISTLDFYVLVPMGIGLLLGGYTFLKLSKYCLTNFTSQTYYAILGFVLGSIFVLYPGFSFNLQGIICITLLLLGVLISMKLEKS